MCPSDRMVAHLWSISFCWCQASHLPESLPPLFSELLFLSKATVLLTQFLLSIPIPILPFRMGLEALVESYAFWRPSLRTLTFEDIPGIPKQGKSPSSSQINIQFLPRSSGTEKWASHYSQWWPHHQHPPVIGSNSFCVIWRWTRKNGSCGLRLSLRCLRLFIYFMTFTTS